MRFIREFQANGGSLLFVSHDTGAVINLCQRAIWLNKGIVKSEGQPKDVAQCYLAELYESQQGESTVVPGIALTDEVEVIDEQMRDA